MVDIGVALDDRAAPIDWMRLRLMWYMRGCIQSDGFDTPLLSYPK